MAFGQEPDTGGRMWRVQDVANIVHGQQPLSRGACARHSTVLQCLHE